MLLAVDGGEGRQAAKEAGIILLRRTGPLYLGEGSGAVAAMPLLDMALAVYRACYTFAEGGIEPYTRL